MKGKFITFEGIEGSGKTTQIAEVAAYLKGKGHEIVQTREPGGTEIGDQIRKILLDPTNTKMSARTELLLYAASRAQHVEEVIRPALKDGKIVLCDRYSDATTAYQGAARNLSKDIIVGLDKIATDHLIPDLTFLFDLPAWVGLNRAHARNKGEGIEDRFENEKLDFHEKVRQGYLKIAVAEPKRVVVIDATKQVETIYLELIERLKSF